MDLDDPKVQMAAFGKQVEYFLRSDIGSYLVKRAKAESEAALESLKHVDPFQPEKVVAYQMKAKIADAIIEWLGDAIADGEASIEQLKLEGSNE